MGKGIYLVYGIVSLGLLAVGYNLYMSSVETEGQALSCLKMHGAAQSQCIKDVERKAAALNSVLKNVVPNN